MCADWARRGAYASSSCSATWGSSRLVSWCSGWGCRSRRSRTISACQRWCGFIEARREHRVVFNRIADQRVVKMLELAHALLADNEEHVAACCRIEETQ